MSVIVAVKDRSKGGVWLAADRQGKMGYNHRVSYNVHKVKQRSGWGLGTCGGIRPSHIVEEYTKGLELRTEKDLFDMVNGIHFRFKELGIGPSPPNDLPFGTDLWLLIVLGGKIFSVTEDYSIIEHRDFFAEGSGGNYAMGCLAGSYGALKPELLIRKSIRVASKLDVYCGAGIEVLWIPK